MLKMTGKMVERVARALWRTAADTFPPSVQASPEGWRTQIAAAKVAIAAMREPTEAMIEASNREWDGRMSHRSSGAWQAMIDAALKDAPVTQGTPAPSLRGERDMRIAARIREIAGVTYAEQGDYAARELRALADELEGK